MSKHNTTVTPPDVEKPDWIINVLQNKLPQASDNSGVTLGALHENELFANDFSIRDANDYWALPEVKDAFTGEDGKPLRGEFDKFYSDQTGDFRGKLEAEHFLATGGNQFSSDMARREGNRMSIPHVSDAMPDLSGRYFSSNMSDAGKFGKAQFSIRENALNNFVQLEDGTKTSVDKYLDANGNGLTDASAAYGLKFAKDKLGNYLTGDNGRPYLVPVKEGEKLNTFDEVYSQSSDVLGRYGLGDSGWDAVTASLIAVPKGGINFLATAVEGVAVLGQVISEPLFGGDSGINGFFTDSQNMMKRTKIASTDQAQSWTSYEGVLDMGVDVAFQLLGLVASGGALTAMGAGAKTASIIPKLGMTTMSAAPIYDLAKERGLSPAESSLLYATAATGLYVLMGADEILVNSLIGKNSKVTSAMLREVGEKALDISVKGGLHKGSIKAFRKNFPDLLRSTLRAASDSPVTAGAGAIILEAGQETSEQMWDTSVRLLFNQYAEMRDKGLSDNEKGGNFSIDWAEEVQSWKQAAVGGALGGAIAVGPMRKFMRNDQANDMLTDFNKAIIQGREKEIYRMIDRLEEQEAFAPKWKDADTGNITNDATKSVNAEAAKIYRAQVDYMVELRDTNELQNFDFGLKEKVNKPIQEALKANLLGGVSGTSSDILENDALYSKFTSAGKDMSRLVLHVDSLKAKLANMTGASPEAREEIQDKVDKAQVRIQKLKNEPQQDYVIEGLYNIKILQDVANNQDSLNVSGKSFVNLNNNAKNVETDIENINKKADNQKEANEKAVLGDPASFEGISVAKKEALLKEVEKNRKDATKALISRVTGSNKNLKHVDADVAIEELRLEGRDAVSDADNKLIDDYNKATLEDKQIREYNAVDNNRVTPGTEAARKVELDKYLKMTEDSSETLSEAQVLEENPRGIQSLIDNQNAELEFSLDSGGNPYTNVDGLMEIAQSISTRVTHVRNTFNMQGVKDVAPMTQEEHDELIEKLTVFEVQVGLLFEAAKNNLANPDLTITKNALAILAEKMNRLNAIAEAFNDGEHVIVSNTIIEARASLEDALDKGNIPEFLKILNTVENLIYDSFSGVKDLNSVVSNLFPKTINSLDEYEKLTKDYFYFRGIVSLRSSDFYNMYGEMLNDKIDGVKPSIEQRLVIKDTTHSLVASENTMPFRWDLDLSTGEGGITPINPEAFRFNDAAYVDGGGGTGKTSVVENAIASMISKRTGKKAFFTSTTDGNKIKNIRKTAVEFGGIQTEDSVSTIEELFASPEKIKEVGIIVFDEATLLDKSDIENYIETIDKINSEVENSADRIKILYGGDFFQNSKLSKDAQSVQQLNVDTSETSKTLKSGSGFTSTDTLIPKSNRLNFSFRSTNLDLAGIANYFQKVQGDFGAPSENKGYSYTSNNEGVKIVHDRDKFLTNVEKFLETLSPEEIADSVYITSDASTVPASIVNTGIRIDTSTKVQGEEWSNVIVDMSDVPFKEDAHQGNTKKSYYTAVTRAKKFLLMTLPESQQITSKRGKVFPIELGTMENATRADELTAIEAILGDSIGKADAAVDRKVTKQKATEKPGNIFIDDNNLEDIEIRQALASFVESFEEDSLKVDTFFTTQRPDGKNKENLEQVLKLKKTLLYSEFKDVVGAYGYRLVLAKQGSKAYTNVIRNDAKYDGQYALFLEGYDKINADSPVKETVIGILGQKGGSVEFSSQLDALVKSTGIFSNGADSIALDMVDQSIFTTDPVHAGSGRGQKDTQLTELKANSTGIAFGTIRIFQKPINKVEGDTAKPSIRAGQGFIPVSFRFNKTEIDRKLSEFKGDDPRNIDGITVIMVAGKNQSVQEMVETLSPFLETYNINGKVKKWFPRDEKNQMIIKKGAFALSTELGSAYASTIGRFANSNSLNEDYSIFTTTLSSVLDSAKRNNADKKYIAFLEKWVGGSTLDTSIKNAFEVDSSILDIDKLTNLNINVKTNKPYFFFQRYVEADANNEWDLPHYQLAMQQLQEEFVIVKRADPNDITKSIDVEVQQFRDGFEFNVVAEKKTGETANTLKSIEASNPDLYNDNIKTSNVEIITQPTVNVSSQNLIAGILGAKVIIPEGAKTNDDIVDGVIEEITNVEMGSDGEDVNNLDPVSAPNAEDDFLIKEGKTLIDFQEAYYPGSNVNRMQNGIDKFKRNVWNNIFRLVGDTPTMNDITDAINNYRGKIDATAKGMGGQSKFFLSNENEHHYHDAVASVAFDFLMDTYFPTLQRDGDTYSAKVSSHKASVYNKETTSLLDDTANEMVKTMLFNTKELYKKDGKIYERDNYLSRNDIEDMIDIFTDSYTNDDIIAAMKEHVDGNNGKTMIPAVMSLYYQFYSDTPYKLNGSGQNIHSLRSIDTDTQGNQVDLPNNMVEGLSTFLRSAAAYKYAHIELIGNEGKFKGRPTPNGKKPNLLRQALFETFKETSSIIKDDINVNEDRSLSISVDSENIINVPVRGAMSDTDIISAFKKLGFDRFNQTVFDTILKVKDEIPDVIRVELTNIIRNVATRVNRSKGQSEEAKTDSFQSILNNDFDYYIVEPVARIDGMHGETNYRNLKGDKVNRLRSKTVLHNIALRVKDIRNNPAAISSSNMFVYEPSADDKSDSYRSYEIVDWVAKDGFKRFNKGFTSTKRHTAFIDSETLEHDIVWGFYNTIKDLSNDSGSETYGLFSPMVYSDGSTDMMAQVKLTREQLENPKKVLDALFTSRKDSYTRMKVLVDAATHPMHGKILNNGKPGIEADELYLDNIKRYVNGTFDQFASDMSDELSEFKKSLPKDIVNAVNSPIGKLGLRNSDDVLEAFYYNWVAVSSELTDITLGKLDNFKPGKSEHDKYVDMAKRAKMQVSARSNMLFRNESWEAEVANYRAANPDAPLPLKLLNEGMKLSRVGKVAYVEDVNRQLTALDMSRYDKGQEVFDGATFANPISKLFQQASAGGQFGTKVPMVSKPVTNSYDPTTGVGVGIKNAEFTLTAEILRDGTPIVHKMMDNMLSATKAALIKIVEARVNQDVTEENIIDITLESVYDAVTDADFQALAVEIVESGSQNEIIHEIIPLSSRKYGGGVANDLNSDKPFVTEQLDFVNKGQQLDATHDVNEHSDLSMLTQYLNALSINYKNPDVLNSIYQSVGKMVDLELDRIGGLEATGEVRNYIRGIVAESINKRVGVSYQHQLVNKSEFTLNDRQIFKVAISQINSELEKNGIRIKLFGSQFVLHPQSSLISLSRDANGRVYKKSEVPEGVEIPEGNTNVDLKWASPTIDGQVLEQHPVYVARRAKYLEDLETNPAGAKSLLREFQNDIDALLSQPGWEPGFAEMLIPMNLANQFNISEADLNRPLDDFNAEFFGSIDKAEDFQRALDMLNVRIPTTGKHSGVVSKVVGFMNGSDNAVFVPPMLLFIQGADQDIDKGNVTGLEAVDGIIPELNDDLTPTERTLGYFGGSKRTLKPSIYRVALGNKIVQGMKDISSAPVNAVESNSAVDALLADMKKIANKKVKSNNVSHKKDSYLSYMKLRRDNQAGKALISIFANSQKAYQTLYAYGKITGESTGLVEQGAELEEISEIFAALINAATDNAKEQILGPLGINESNANMVAYMVMKGRNINEIADLLTENASGFQKLEKSTHYAAKPFNPAVFNNVELTRIFKGGQELSLLGTSILNTNIPNSPFDSFKYQFRINKHVSAILGEDFDFEKFINDNTETYANDFIAKYDEQIANPSSDASFNLLKILNPFNSAHPSNQYIKLYKKSRNLKSNNLPIVEHVDNLVTEYMAGFKPQNSVSDTIYEDAVNFVYGLGMHDYLSKPEVNSRIGDYELSNINQRSEWIKHFNTVTIHELKAKYGNRDDENLFISSLRPVKVKRVPYEETVVYSLPDMRNMDESTILTYDVSFNNKNLLDESDKNMLIMYNLITTGGKHGKGSYAQIFKYNDAQVQGFNQHLDGFLDNLSTDGMSDMFDKFLRDDVVSTKKLLPNAIPYGYSNDVTVTESSESNLKLNKENLVDDLINGDKDALSYSDTDLNKSTPLKNLVEFFDTINQPRGEVLPTVSKIINAGGTGVESEALRAASDILNIPTGGTIKKGFITEGNAKNKQGAEKYGLTEGGVAVSRDNVNNSDVSIIFGGISGSEIKTLLKHAQNLNKPVLVEISSAPEAASTGAILRDLGVEHVMFNTTAELRSALELGAYSTINITGQKGSKLDKKTSTAVFRKIISALTQKRSVTYRSVTGSDLSTIVTNDDGSFTKFDKAGKSIDVEKVYYAKIPADIAGQLDEADVRLVPTVNRNGELTEIQDYGEVKKILQTDEKIALSLYRGAFPVENSVALDFSINPRANLSAVTEETGSGNQSVINDITVDKGLEDAVSQTSIVKLQGYSSNASAEVTYYGKLSPSEAQGVVADKNDYVKGYEFGKSSTPRHIFTINVSPVSVVHDKLDVAMPETYDFDKNGALSKSDAVKVLAHIKKITDVDTAKAYMNDFGVNGGSFYIEALSILNSKFNNFSSYTDTLSPQTRALLEKSSEDGLNLTESQAKEVFLVNTITENRGKSIPTELMGSLIRDIESYSSDIELKHYIAKVFKNSKSINSSNKQQLLTAYKARISVIGGSTYNTTRRKKRTTGKRGGTTVSSKAKTSTSQMKGNGRTVINMGELISLLKTHQETPESMKPLFNQIIAGMTANMSVSNVTKAIKMMKDSEIDNGTISEFLEVEVTQGGATDVVEAETPDITIHPSNLEQVKELFSDFGHTIETDNINLFDVTSDGLPVAEALIDMVNSSDLDESELDLVNNLLMQHQAIQRDYTESEIEEFVRRCN